MPIFRALRAKRHSRGFALVTTIWGLGLIVLLGTAAIVGARYRANGASITAHTARAALAAESAVNLAIAAILNGPGLSTFPLHCSLPGGEDAFVTVDDEAGKIDLNSAPAELLAQVFSKLAGDQNLGQRITSQIVQFRQSAAKPIATNTPANPPNSPSLPDAPASLQLLAYSKAGVPLSKTGVPMVQGAPFQSPNDQAAKPSGAFVTIMQLDQVADLSPRLFRAALPFVTVHSGRSELQRDAVSPGLRRLLTLPSPPVQPQPPRNVANLTLRADILSPDGARFVREALVSFKAGPQPFIVHEWRHADIDASAEPVHRQSSPDCLRSGKDQDIPAMTKYWD